MTVRDGDGMGSCLDFYTASEVCVFLFSVQLNVAVRPQTQYGLLQTGSPGQPPRLSISQLLSSEPLRSETAVHLV